MYSTSVKIVTSYKAINLPYENNVSSLVSLVILFHSLSLCSWFLPVFILNSTSAWWKMNANWRSWKNTTKNLKSSVVGNFFFPFFPRWSQEGSYTSVLCLIDLYLNVFTASFPLFPDSGKPQSLTSKISISIPHTVRKEFLIILLWEFRVESNNFSPLIAGQTVSHLASQPANQSACQSATR